MKVCSTNGIQLNLLFFVRTFKKFIEMKTESQNADGVQFLRTVKQSAQKNPGKHIHWYSSQNMGEHRIGKWKWSHCCNVN